MSKTDEKFKRINAIIGDPDEDFGEAVGRFFKHLKANLQLPCEVKGIEDFQWEERYVIGGWSVRDYEKLKKTQPSYSDRYQLLEIEPEGYSQWMMHGGEDIAAHVQRASDGKKFVLGLSELEGTDKESANLQLLNDYSVFFCNYR